MHNNGKRRGRDVNNEIRRCKKCDVFRKCFQYFPDCDFPGGKIVRVLNVKILSPPVQSDHDWNVDPMPDEIPNTKMNETFVTKAAIVGVSNEETENVSNKDTLNVQENAMPEASNDIGSKIMGEFVKMIKLPNNDIPGYQRNEELLDYGSFYEEALIKHLQPYNNEDITEYMNRTIFIVFTEQFLLNFVSWKDEPGRMNMKRSTLLVCWKASYEKRFRPDPEYAEFIKQFRRIKSALRAKNKGKQMRIAKGRVTKVKKGKSVLSVPK